jgi:pSer/pThr/pTyr-binding forkhead associated (FHA) protein
MPTLEVNGQRFLLKVGQTTIGRDVTADIQIHDTGLSRVHFAIIWDGRNAAAKDLKSTNGTRISGRPISEIAIQGDTQIQAGTNTFVFKVVARTINNDMAVSE